MLRMTQPVIRPAREADAPVILELVKDAGLAVPGVVEHLGSFLVAERQGRAVGAIGLELRGQDGLLRSAVVAPEERGSGVGAALTDAVLALARRERVEHLYLLTTTAEQYWARHGFTRITRDDVPEAVKRSEEFTGACPASAAVMMRAVG
jgi:N-acetylglutamate synthase-like GNAT family acetyltransferase